MTADEGGRTLIRKSVDPNKPDFLTQVFKKDDQNALLESAQRYLSTLHRVSDLLSRATGVEALFDSILATILEVTGGTRAAILMRAVNPTTEDADIQVVAVRTRTRRRPIGQHGALANRGARCARAGDFDVHATMPSRTRDTSPAKASCARAFDR